MKSPIKITVSKIEVVLGEKTLTLSVEDAKRLQAELNKAFPLPTPEPQIVHVNRYVPRSPSIPSWPSFPTITCHADDMESYRQSSRSLISN